MAVGGLSEVWKFSELANVLLNLGLAVHLNGSECTDKACLMSLSLACSDVYLAFVSSCYCLYCLFSSLSAPNLSGLT